eukprot:3754329-Ditylum_brightwellii.AAC.1
MIDGLGDGFVLKLMKNIYGQKQAGRVWHEHLKAALEDIGFTALKINEFVFYKGTIMFLCYVNDSIFSGPSSEEIDDAIEQLRKRGFKMEDKGTMQDYIGINIEYLP